jgi:hypothetical protein
MEKDELKKALKKYPPVRIVGKLQLISLLAVIVSPFIWIWHTWELAWQIGLSGIVGVIICYFADLILKEAIQQVVDGYVEPKSSTKSRFQERLEEEFYKRQNQPK